MIYNRYVLSSLLVCVCLLLVGCFSSTPHLTSKIQSANYLNPNIYHKGSPVVVVVYQLKSATTFKHANFFSLYNDPLKTLGPDLLDKQELEIRPNEHKDIDQLLAPGANYVGVVAGYRNPDVAHWREVVALKDSGKNTKLTIALQTERVIAKIA